MIGKKGGMVLAIFILIVAFTEIVGLNFKIAFNYLPIVFAILTLIVFNIRLKKNLIRGKEAVFMNAVVILVNIILTSIIARKITFASLLPVLIFSKSLEKIDVNTMDGKFFKGIIKSYIAPLILFLVIYVVYFKLVTVLSNMTQSWWDVNYFSTAMEVTFRVILADFCMVMLVQESKDIIDSKVNIEPKDILIVATMAIITIMIIKISITIIAVAGTNKKIGELEEAIDINKLETFYTINFNENITASNAGDIEAKEEYYKKSFNNILTKGEANRSELVYKKEAENINTLFSRRRYSRKMATAKYLESSENYVKRLEKVKEDLYMQVVFYTFIYIVNILCIAMVYKKSEE